MENIVIRTALSGGPKAGKTSAKRIIEKVAREEFGYKTYFVGETATEVIKAGLLPPKKPETDDKEEWRKYFEGHIRFQALIMSLQISKELSWYKMAKESGENVLLVFDRAIPDNIGYLEKLLQEIEIFKQVFQREDKIDLYRELLSEFGLTPEEVMECYDAVICLETSVKYMKFEIQEVTDTTQRLEEGAREALEVNYFVSNGWKSHKYYIEIPATEKYEDKEEMLADAIRELLSREIAMKLERK